MLRILELQGFKSFPEKTVLEFPQGIAAIVGPNGSGKSNLVDAIRWVFGEQSTKNIRASSSQEVIFNGTLNRPASSVAWVNLVFDNQKKLFHLDFEQVEIKRKIYRDGTSEYFLNQKQIRLKELIQLLASARLGVKGLGIVNQGASDIFLRANSWERREMIEEMIGLKEIRLKKQEAERKIKETKNNLAQVELILQEIEPNLRSLKRQVERWQSRQAKETELKELERSYFLEKLSQLNWLNKTEIGSLETEETKVVALKEELRQEEQRWLELQQQEPELMTAAKELKERLDQLQQQKNDLLRVLGKVEGQLDFLTQLPPVQVGFDLAEAKQKLEAVAKELEELLKEDKLESLKERLRSLLEDLKRFLLPPVELSSTKPQTTLLQERQRLTETLGQLEEKINQLRVQQQELRTRETEKARAFQSLFFSLQEKRKLLAQLEETLIQARLKQERVKFQQEELKKELSEAGWDWESFLRENQEKLNQAQAREWGEEREREQKEREKKILRLRQELFSIGEIDSQAVAEYHSLAERYEFLSQQKKDLELALADLEKLSLSLEEKISSDFETALRAIDKEFHHYFGVIFEGGRGNLKIEKVIDPETQTAVFGIELQVSLPRKKINSLELLSGGERALTALAFLFAVINYARPPFLVLDEVDAALDEANSRKLARLLKEMAKEQTQFILITHNRAVMEAADVLYGVTMADGVSKVFSLKFAEAEQLVETKRSE